MTMLTTEQLNAIKERAEKATAGPWGANDGVVVTLSIRDRKYNEPEDIAEMSYDFENDAEFIAQARTDIPALLQSIEELKKALIETTEESDTFRENLKTIERLTECETTRDFATRALKGEATLRIGGDADD